MKKIYANLMLAILAIVGFSAKAEEITFTLKVNVPNVVTYSINGESALLTETETTVTYNDEYGYGAYVSLSATSDYRFKGVKDALGQSMGYGAGDYASFTANDGTVANIEVYNLDESRTASFTLNVDDPSGVMASFGNSERLNITENTQVVKYDPSTENVLNITSSNYQKPLYQVTLDGSPVADYYGTYTLTLTEGCTVDVKANYPDKDCTINFVLSEGAEGVITSVSLNGTQVEDFNGTSLTAKLGDSFSFEYDTSYYKVESVKINGESQPYLYGSYNGTVMNDMTIEIDANKYGDIECTINIDHPEYVVVYTRDSNYNEVPMTLEAGNNTIKLNEANPSFFFYAKANCYIESVVGPDAINYKERGSVDAEAGATYTFTTGKIELDQVAIIYVDQPDGWTYFSASSTVDRQPIELKAGYNTLDFSLAYNPYGFSWYGCDNNGIYLNGEAVAPMYEGSTSYQVTLANDDVLKLYLAAEPVECKVSFEVAEGVEAAVTRDIVVAVPDYKDGLTVFNGTQFAVEGTDIKVAVNDEDVAADEAGKYVFTVNADAKVAITGVNSVSAINAEKVVDTQVYNMQGIKVGTAEDVNKLPAGLYIVSGRKVVVK